MSNRNLTLLIVAGLILWAGFLAVGSFLGGQDLPRSLARGGLIFGFMAAFIGGWVYLLNSAVRKSRSN